MKPEGDAMTGGEMTILVTSLLGFAGTLVAQWAVNSKANRVAADAVDIREQDRLDREQLALDIRERQRLDIEMLKAQTEAANTEIKRALAVNERTSIRQQSTVLKALEVQTQELSKNTEATIQGAQRAEDALHEANTVNQKLQQIGIAHLADKLKSEERQDRIEGVVTETRDAIAEVRSIVANGEAGVVDKRSEE